MAYSNMNARNCVSQPTYQQLFEIINYHTCYMYRECLSYSLELVCEQFPRTLSCILIVYLVTYMQGHTNTTFEEFSSQTKHQSATTIITPLLALF